MLRVRGDHASYCCQIALVKTRRSFRSKILQQCRKFPERNKEVRTRGSRHLFLLTWENMLTNRTDSPKPPQRPEMTTDYCLHRLLIRLLVQVADVFLFYETC